MTKKQATYWTRSGTVAALIWSTALAMTPVEADAGLFARFGSIKGEANHHTYKDHVVVESMEWEGIHPTSIDGRSSTQPIISEVIITANFDKAAPKLADRALKGEPISEVTIEFTRQINKTEFRYLQYKLTDVEVAAYEFAVASTSEQSARVRLRLRFRKVRLEYNHRKEQGAHEVVFASYPRQ